MKIKKITVVRNEAHQRDMKLLVQWCTSGKDTSLKLLQELCSGLGVGWGLSWGWNSKNIQILTQVRCKQKWSISTLERKPILERLFFTLLLILTCQILSSFHMIILEWKIIFLWSWDCLSKLRYWTSQLTCYILSVSSSGSSLDDRMRFTTISWCVLLIMYLGMYLILLT